MNGGGERRQKAGGKRLGDHRNAETQRGKRDGEQWEGRGKQGGDEAKMKTWDGEWELHFPDHRPTGVVPLWL